ncbi:hypothetical protein CNMCM5878_000031 [Aspergillus fumigatiaffinis]|nr:hypothetical protein CNMCM5878_000031 [Aspergillus fumigatiaffinis]
MYSLAVQAGFALFLLSYCLNIIHSLYFHPLRRIPGPKLWIIFPVLRHISAVRGRLDLDIPRFHAVYGPAVRFGRDEVSFITPEAWNDIYGHGHRQLPKVLNSASNPMDIVSSNDADHTRFRKSLSHAFSARGLQAQEPFINTYVDKLIAQLKGVAKSQLPADMAKWFNLITFDIIGDLAFGEPFYGLESTQYHHWVATIFESVKLFPFVKMKDTYPTVFNLVSLFVPKRLLEAQKEQIAHAREAVKKRLHNSSAYNRGDFMDSMCRNRGKDDGLSEEEMVANANILIIAGSETTATLLAGLIYFLLRNPDALAKVVTEVRSTMKTEADITCNSAGARLPYMLACIQESFRLYPPVPTGLQRMTLEPMTIAGYDVPAGTKVSVHPMGASWSSLNFYAPDRFLPERWLPEVKSDPTSPFFSDKREVVQPFSVGPRNCIGRNLAFAEMRLILARLLWNFDLELCEESLAWSDQKAYTIWEKPPLMCGNGFLGSHVLGLLLDRGYSVVTTVRSHEKAEQIRECHHRHASTSQLQVIIVPDFTSAGDFDECFISDAPFDVVIHTASPFRYSITDIQRELLDPAIGGTIALLEAVRKSAPSVKKVIVTSSFASIINSYKGNSWVDHTYSEEDWNPITLSDAHLNPLNGYRASKTFAERACWEFLERENPPFSLVTLCPTLMFGPVVHPLRNLDELNTSNQRIRNFMVGEYKAEIPDTGTSFFLWIDVRDAALAHIRAMEAPGVGNKRFLLTAGYFSNKEICEVIRESFSEYRPQLPEQNAAGGGYPPGGLYRFDNSQATEKLGLTYRTLSTSITDTVISLQKLQN